MNSSVVMGSSASREGRGRYRQSWIGILALVLGLLSGCATMPSSLRGTVAEQDDTWLKVRRRFPLHIQGIAVSPPRSDGRRTLVIAEPPPQVTLELLQQVDPAAIEALGIASHRIGFDGWTKDVVAHLRPLSEESLRSVVSKLHVLMFGTSYKARLLDLAAPQPAMVATEMNLRVTPSELNVWIAQNPLLRPLGRRALIPLQQVLQSIPSGVFLSTKGDLVAWVLPQRRPLTEFTAEARMFALETDAVIGAVGRGNHVLIFGRPRINSVESVPPLRTETLLQLAAVRVNELAQSYERSSLFAGRWDGQDWAPILLSQELINTELGSLLNITDQLLKSWSEHGTVHYKNFHYPAPESYPFSGVLSEIAPGHSVTFNWNTQGLGHTLELPDYSLYVVNGTGALPIMYNTESGRLGFFELMGRFNFAKSGDPNLARVVEYTALYQIFQEFGIAALPPVPKTPSVTIDRVLEEAGHAAVLRIMRNSPSECARLARQYAEYIHNVIPYSIVANDEKMAMAHIVKLQTELRDVERRRGGNYLRQVAYASASQPNLHMLATTPESEQQRLIADYKALIQLAARVSKESPFLHGALDSPRIFRQRATVGERESQGSWIHTPTSVQSRIESATGALVIGGHNLSAEVEHTRGPASVATVSALMTTEPPRALAQALGLPARRSSLPLFRPAPTSASKEFGWGEEDSRDQQLMAKVSRLRDPDTDVVYLERRDQGLFFATNLDGGNHFALSSREDVEDVLLQTHTSLISQGRPLRVYSANMTDAEVQGVLINYQFRARAKGLVRSIEFVTGRGSEKPTFSNPVKLSQLRTRALTVSESLQSDHTGQTGHYEIKVPYDRGFLKITTVAKHHTKIPSGLKQRIVSIFLRVIERFRSFGREPREAELRRAFAVDLRRELGSSGTEILVQVQSEFGDTLFVFLPEGNDNVDPQPAHHAS